MTPLRTVVEAMHSAATETHAGARTRSAECYWDGRATALAEVLDLIDKLTQETPR